MIYLVFSMYEEMTSKLIACFTVMVTKNVLCSFERDFEKTCKACYKKTS